jgi:Rod binding domain-containing protein
MDALERAADARLGEATATQATSAREREAQRTQLRLLAQEFEALLMNELLGEWRRSLVDGSENGDADDGMGTMVDMVGSEFGRALAKSGGLGIAAQLLRAFDRQLMDGESQTALEDPINRNVAGERVQHRTASGDAARPVSLAVPAALAPLMGSTMPPSEPELMPVGGQVTSASGSGETRSTGR